MIEFEDETTRIENEAKEVLKVGLTGDGCELNKLFDKINRSDWEEIRDIVNEKNAATPDQFPKLKISTLRDEMLIVQASYVSHPNSDGTLIMTRDVSNMSPNGPDLHPPFCTKIPKN